MATAIGAYVTTAIVKARLDISAVTWDAQIGVVCDQVNQYIEGATGRVLAPVSSATRTFDGTGTPCLRVRQGVRAVSLLECAYYTGASYGTVPASNYFLQPNVDQLAPGEPYTQICLTDFPTAGFPIFFPGYDTVRVTATWGPAAIPDDIAELAAVLAIRAWHAAEVGQQGAPTFDEATPPINSRWLSSRDRDTLRRYTTVDMLA